MKTRRILVLAMLVSAIAASVVSPALAQTPDPQLGIWQMNIAQSRFSPDPPPRFQVSTWEPWEGGMKVTTYIVSAGGAVNCQEVITKLDGADSPLTDCSTVGSAAPPSATGTTRAYRRAADGSLENVTKVSGRVTTTGRQTIPRDGRTRTLVTTGTNATGQAVNNSVVYERR